MGVEFLCLERQHLFKDVKALLREILFLASIFSCLSLDEIYKNVKDQFKDISFVYV